MEEVLGEAGLGHVVVHGGGVGRRPGVPLGEAGVIGSVRFQCNEFMLGAANEEDSVLNVNLLS